MEDPQPPQPIPSPARPIRTAEILSVGSEILVGETRDTNAGELARGLAETGVVVGRLAAVPDRLPVVAETFAAALERADLVVSTGGLGPTPDDLTREAIAELCAETPAVDPALEAWLEGLFTRRHLPFPAANLKQAWLIPSATAIPNPRGTAPGWWVERPDGRLVVALPGPPSEMRAMWRDWVLPRLRERGLGTEVVTRTYRLTGIGESHVATLLGDALLRAENPLVATYARADAVDVRISATADGDRSAADLFGPAEAAVLRSVGRWVWGRDQETWPDAIGRELAERGWQVATAEIGTGGSLVALVGHAAWLRRAVVMGLAEDAGDGSRAEPGGSLPELAESARQAAGVDIGLAVAVVEAGGDTRVDLAAAGPWGRSEDRRVAFLGGSEGRRRAALAALSFLYDLLRHAQGREHEPAGSADNVGHRQP